MSVYCHLITSVYCNEERPYIVILKQFICDQHDKLTTGYTLNSISPKVHYQHVHGRHIEKKKVKLSRSYKLLNNKQAVYQVVVTVGVVHIVLCCVVVSVMLTDVSGPQVKPYSVWIVICLSLCVTICGRYSLTIYGRYLF